MARGPSGDLVRDAASVHTTAITEALHSVAVPPLDSGAEFQVEGLGDDATFPVICSLLPAVLNVGVPLRVPRKARKRLGKIAMDCLNLLTSAIAAQSADEVMMEYALRLKLLSVMLLRFPHNDVSVEASACASLTKEAAHWKQVRRLLQLAESNEWCKLARLVVNSTRAGGDPDSEWRLQGRSGDSGEQDDSRAAKLNQKEVAAKKALSGVVRTAAQILKGQSMLQASAETARLQENLLVCERSAESNDEFNRARDAAWEAGGEHRLKIKIQTVRLKLSTLRVGAQAGGSRTRNDVILCLAESHGGWRALVDWCQLWADGAVPSRVAEVFLEQTMRPLRKPSGGPRNISLMEVLFKFASGVIQEQIRRCGRNEGLAWNQYGGMPAGPETLLLLGQGVAALRPDLAIVSLDVENAFGTMKRSQMLRGAARYCPKACRFLCNIWGAANVAWIETSKQVWKKVFVLEGTAQGDTSSSSAFSRGYRLALEEASAKLATDGVHVHLPSLVDDLLLITEPEHVDRAVHEISAALAEAGAKLKVEKCAAFVPQRSRDGSGHHPDITSVKQVFGGLPALGAAYGGDYESLLGPFSTAAEPARKRLDAAKALLQECAGFAEEGHAIATRQAAWVIAQKVASRALQYDLRVLEPHEISPLAAELEEAMQKTATALVSSNEGEWSSHVAMQTRWPTECGGMAMGSPALAAKCGRIACLAQCLPVAREHLKRMFPDTEDDAILQAVSLDGVKAQLQDLNNMGIELSAAGKIAVGNEPRLDLSTQFAPARGVMGEIVRSLFEVERSHVLAALEQVQARCGNNEEGTQAQRSQARLRSCCGGSSLWAECIPSRSTLRLRDAEFVTAMRWRLGLPLCKQDRCQLRSANSLDAEDTCGILLDVHGDHAVSCKKGGGAQRVHGAVAHVIGGAARECGAEVAYERTVPELLHGEPGSEEAIEAVLDVHVWCAYPVPVEVWVDVTCRHPFAKRYRNSAARVDGHAAKLGEDDKASRYGSGSGGVVVTTAAIESWGRMGAGFESLLGKLENAWAARHFAGPVVAAQTSRRWREEIGIVQARSLHRSVEMAQYRAADTAAEG